MKLDVSLMRYRKLSEATHRDLLIHAVASTRGAVLELGCGPGSTKLLHVLVASNNRFLRSVDNHRDWLNDQRIACCGGDTKNHKFTIVDDWDTFTAHQRHWSVILVDQAPAAARGEFLRLVDSKVKSFDFIVVHDTEERYQKEYKFNDIFEDGTFKCVLHDADNKIRATVVSNNEELFNKVFR